MTDQNQNKPAFDPTAAFALPPGFASLGAQAMPVTPVQAPRAAPSPVQAPEEVAPAAASAVVPLTEPEVMTPGPLGGKTASIDMGAMLAFKDLDLDHPSVAGANVTVSWKGDVDTEVLRKAFQDAGVEERLWPINAGPAQALKRALNEAYGASSTYRIDPIGRGQGWGVSIKDSAMLAAYLAAGADEKLRDDAKHAYTTYLTVSVHKDGEKLGLMFSPPDHADAQKVTDLFNKHQGRIVYAEDVSVLFSTKILPAAGVTGRGPDQVWFAKKGSGLDLLKRVRTAILAVSTLDKDGTLVQGGKVRLTAQVMTVSFIETIMDSLISDADRMLGKIDDEIDDLGDKALSSRITEINRMKRELGEHANILGASVECITERLSKMEGKVASARAKVWEEQAKQATAMASQVAGGNTVLS